ncbi:MAG: DUF4389 domain-containing protein [Gammaproteobacteria bacterium]|nr:DUF4389 domain-containing protein [Gammaproteobacteria bacterium]
MSTVQENVKNVDTWLRGLFIVVFGIIFYVLVTIIWLLVIFQFITAVVSGGPNANLKDFSEALTKYAYQVLRYMTFGTEERPWPFSPWPGGSSGTT